jgi:LPXTG-motif cell wall-anchored protein
MYLWNRQSVSYLGGAGLGYRPNQALQRGYLTPVALGELGQTSSVNLPLLVGGVALLGVAGWLFFGRRRSPDKKRIARLAAQRAIAARELREAGA